LIRPLLAPRHRLDRPRAATGVAAAVVLGALASTLGSARLARAADGGDTGSGDGGVVLDGGAADADAGVAPEGGAGPAAPAVAATPAPPPVALRGTVVARGGRRRVKGATVMIDGALAAETDAAGGFEAVVPPGRHHLQISAMGLAPIDLPIDVGPDGWTGVVRLSPGGHTLETVVTAKQPTTAVRIGGEEARSTPGTAGEPFRIIESLPGVSQVVWPFALYAIRGANPGNTGFFLDGMRVPALFHFALGPSIVHPYLVDKLDFYPGGYPARFGGYVSGAVAAETAAPPNDGPRFSVDARVYDIGGLATSPWDGGRGTVAVAARYSFTGLVVSHLFSGVSFGYADYELRADHAVGGGRLSLLALGSFDALDIEGGGIAGISPNDNQIGNASLNFHRVDLRWDRPTGGGRLLARTTFAIDNASSQLFASPIAVRAYTVAPRLAFAHAVGGAGTIEVGVEGEAQHFHTDVVIMPSTPPLGDLAQPRNAANAAAYATAMLRFGPLGVEPGLRYSAYAEQGTTAGAIEPRLTARLALGGGHALLGTVGRFSQMPSLPVSVAGFEGFGLRDFGLQTSTQASGGVQTRLPADLALELTGFYQWLHVSDLRSTFSRDVRDSEFLEMRAGRGYGGELLLRLPERGRVRGWIAYTLSWSVRDFDGVYAPSDWDQRHILNVVSTVALGRGWSLGGRFHYNTGRPYPVETQFNTVDYYRLPSFWQLDLRAARRVVFDRATMEFFVELGNVTLTPEVVALQRITDSGPPTNVGFRIVLPTVGVHIDF
jgi:hypothetical protein